MKGVNNHTDKFGVVGDFGENGDEKKGEQSSESDVSDDPSDDEDQQGTPWEKILPIAAAAKFRMGKEKVIKGGDERDHALNETEQTVSEESGVRSQGSATHHNTNEHPTHTKQISYR